MSPRAAMPAFRAPQLAALVKVAPEGDGWVHELKFDGYRILARLGGGRARLDSRNGNDYGAHFPAVRRAVERLPCASALLDGEVAVLMPDGQTRFQALQGSGDPDGQEGGGALIYFVFDLLELDGADLAPRPLLERKAALAALLKRAGAGRGTIGTLRYSDHVVGHGGDFFRTACRQGLEGIVSKRAAEPYRAGRGAAWVKTKCVGRQELVIGGFTDEKSARGGLGALLVGHFVDGALAYAGKVGTGFQKTARELHRELAARRRDACPFAIGAPTGALARAARWVEPELVAEIEFAEWTADDRLRHPSFKGLRRDKAARDVVREEPRVGAAAVSPPTARSTAPTARSSRGRRPRPRRTSPARD